MQPIIINHYEPKTKSLEGRAHIYDLIRKKYLVLTPEELVRQSFIHYLIKDLNYPKSMISVEREVKIGVKSNRSDIRILSDDGKCFMLIECKSFKTKINQNTFDQAAKYSSSLKANYLVATNGITTYCCSVDHTLKKVAFLEAIPDYPETISSS